MTKLSSVSAVTLVLAFALLAAPARSDNARQAVEAGNRAFITAFVRGDATAVAALYTEDAQVIAPGSPVVSGRPAIAEFWQTSIESGMKDVALETIDVESDGTLAYETGIVRLVAEEGAVTSARYVVVWKRIREKWFLHRDIWNSSE